MTKPPSSIAGTSPFGFSARYQGSLHCAFGTLNFRNEFVGNVCEPDDANTHRQIVQSAILFVWIAANLAMRGWEPLPVHSSQSRSFVLGGLRADHHDEPEPAARYRSQGPRRNEVPDQCEGGPRDRVAAEKIDKVREKAVRMLTELLEQAASGARESDADGERPS